MVRRGRWSAHPLLLLLLRVTPRCPALHYQDTAIAAQCPVAATSPHLHSYEHAHHIPGYGLLRDYMQLLFNYLHTILIKNWFPVVTLYAHTTINSYLAVLGSHHTGTRGCSTGPENGAAARRFLELQTIHRFCFNNHGEGPY